MSKFNTGNEQMDEILGFLSGNNPEEDEAGLKFNLGDIVVVERGAGGSPKEGTIAEVVGRRYGYPKSMGFDQNYLPLSFLKHLDGNPGGGEICESCLRLATEEERKRVGR